jgi:hypothetical protein
LTPISDVSSVKLKRSRHNPFTEEAGQPDEVGHFTGY